MPRTTDAPKQTPAAERVRERFAATLTSRIDTVSKFMNQLADDRIDAHFEAALSKGENPYAGDHRNGRTNMKVAPVVVFDATTDLASGNKVDVKQAYDVIAKDAQEWAAVIARLTKKLSDVGYEVYFANDADTAKIEVLLHDPEFESTMQTALSADS